MTIVLEMSTPTGLGPEAHRALMRLVAAIKHTLRMGSQNLKSALLAKGASAGWEQIDSDQLAVVIDNKKLIEICGQYAPLTTTDEGVDAARSFIEQLDQQTEPESIPVTWLDSMTLYGMLQDDVITTDEHKLMTLFISAVQRLLTHEHPCVMTLRVQLPDPPKIDGIMHDRIISDLMLLTAINDWDLRHILLESFSATITYATVQQLRDILGRLMAE